MCGAARQEPVCSPGPLDAPHGGLHERGRARSEMSPTLGGADACSGHEQRCGAGSLVRAAPALRLLRAWTCWASEDMTVSKGGMGAVSCDPEREVMNEPTHPPKREYRDAAEPALVPRTGTPPGGIICTGHTQCESRAVVAEARS